MTRNVFQFIKSRYVWLAVGVLYFGVHVFRLTQLPVFADEAIYLRWAQLILSDWQQYLLFPLNDGKTPFFIWMLAPFVAWFTNPLWAGRLVSVLGGFFQLVLIVQILKQLKVHRAGQLAGALMVCFLPFWFFHHRMVLMDGWLTVWISLATLAFLRVSDVAITKRQSLIWLVVGAGAVWAGLMTKVPFILAVPPLLLLLFINRGNYAHLRLILMKLVTMVTLGILLFVLLAVTPVFPQLFSRGSDFLMPVNEVLGGTWRETVPSIPTYLGYFVRYSGWGVVLLAILGLYQPGKRRAAWIFAGSFFLFCAPIWLLGKVVYPRYLFPAMLYVTLIASIGVGTLWQWSTQKFQTVKRSFAIKLLVGLLILQASLTSVNFIIPNWTNIDAIPFVSSDVTQYLASWSSGHGITQTYAYLQSLAAKQQSGTIHVATEGSFGTLPDGLLLYNFRNPLNHVRIEGVGFPVESLPPAFYSVIQPGDTVLLVVNSDRLIWKLAPTDLMHEYCRPANEQCLQIWDISQTYQQFKKH